MNVKEMLRDLEKLKFTSSNLYLLTLRQTLINQKEILLSTHRGAACQLVNATDRLVKRIEEFIENQQ